MDNIINIRDVSWWWTANMLKASIAKMKSLNTEGQYNTAIEKEENILRSFFDEALGRLEAETQQVAAQQIARAIKQEQGMRDITEILVGIACLTGIVAAFIYINAHVTWGCIFGTCAFITH